MQHIPHPARLAEALAAAEPQGTGNLLRIVLVVMVLGCALAAWFLLRGYKKDD
ncbi:hypothetical protein [Streptomyces ziwulingensis]|uniref:Uncharacterized protein n=1 Tax=Streptomyces ziwulingensis TaxID=1045501 RepID=A0ABP9BYP9_9ACTN